MSRMLLAPPLAELENLSHVGASLSVSENDAMASLEALSALASVGDNLSVVGTGELQSQFSLTPVSPKHSATTIWPTGAGGVSPPASAAAKPASPLRGLPASDAGSPG